MKCPYCAEEIKDEAMICRHCRQNLVLLKSFSDRLSQLEDQTTEITVAIGRLESDLGTLKSSSISTGISVEANQRFKYSFLLITFLPVLLTATGYWFFRFALIGIVFRGGFYFLIFSVLCPLPFGLWIGLKWHGTHPLAYALLGALVAVTDAGAIAFVFWTVEGDLAPIWIPGTSGFLLGHALMFVSGALIGDWMRRKKSPASAQGGYAVKIAKSVLGRKDKSPEAASRIKRLAEIITALAPILTFLGSIVAAYLSYKANINKK